MPTCGLPKPLNAILVTTWRYTLSITAGFTHASNEKGTCPAKSKLSPTSTWPVTPSSVTAVSGSPASAPAAPSVYVPV